MNTGRNPGATTGLAIVLPLVAIVLMFSFNGVSVSAVSQVRLDLVLIGLAACVSAGIGLWGIGAAADRLGFIASALLGLADVGLMVAGASALRSISNGEAPSGGAGLAQMMIVALVLGGVAFLSRWSRDVDPTGADE
ncbi:hypothetical protein [Tsukamurella paurometabola]|uniref:Uncharacterized protein n=1 Tax=Tsukamurella paurometabola TaxID=2061 RepID=A0ABS5NJ59_TSUPA|nr:hypothetical protein [Tsukamurella paurometabola]MBS4104339.1 hypothetical protein [Tsukamurella paurometabola]